MERKKEMGEGGGGEEVGGVRERGGIINERERKMRGEWREDGNGKGEIEERGEEELGRGGERRREEGKETRREGESGGDRRR